jgi:hypothetical protein
VIEALAQLAAGLGGADLVDRVRIDVAILPVG